MGCPQLFLMVIISWFKITHVKKFLHGFEFRDSFGTFLTSDPRKRFCTHDIIMFWPLSTYHRMPAIQNFESMSFHEWKRIWTPLFDLVAKRDTWDVFWMLLFWLYKWSCQFKFWIYESTGLRILCKACYITNNWKWT